MDESEFILHLSANYRRILFGTRAMLQIPVVRCRNNLLIIAANM